MAMSVLYAETGKSFEYRQLRQHPKYKDIWEQSYSNELGLVPENKWIIDHPTWPKVTIGI